VFNPKTNLEKLDLCRCLQDRLRGKKLESIMAEVAIGG
jgi:hypothetical protein